MLAGRGPERACEDLGPARPPHGGRDQSAESITPTEFLASLPLESAAHPSLANPSFGFPSRDAAKAGINFKGPFLSFHQIRNTVSLK